MKTIKNLLTKDIGWKLLSFGLALGLWFVVINTQNPIETRNYSIYPQIENEKILEENGLVATNLAELSNMRITVKIRGERISLDRLSKDQGSLKATINLSTALATLDYNTPIAIPIEISGYGSLELENKLPEYASVTIERLVSADKKVVLNITGSAWPGYSISGTITEPEYVTVSGPESLVASVSEVRCEISVNEIQSDIVLSAPPAAYNADGEIIEGLYISADKVTATLHVTRNKTVPFSVSTTGWPVEGFVPGGITISPSDLEITGDTDTLKSVSAITLPAIDISDSTEDIVSEYLISDILPSGITAESTAPQKVTVIVKISEESQKTLSLSLDDITLEKDASDNYSAEITSAFPMNITLKGSKDALSELEYILASVNISGLAPGSHSVELSFDLPDNVRTVTDYAVTVNIGYSSN